MKKILALAMMATTFLCISCSKEPNGSKKLRFEQDSYSIIVGQTIMPDFAAKPDGATIEWSSNNPEVATVTNGFVTGWRDGSAIITAKAGKVTASTTMLVSHVNVTDFRISGSNEVGINSSLTLYLSDFQPGNGNVANLNFLVPDSPVVEGKLDAPDAWQIFSVTPNVSNNSVVVTCSANAKDGYLFYLDIRDYDNNPLKTYKITCADRPLQSISLSNSTYTVRVEKSFNLRVSTTPSSPTDGCSFSWSVSDPSILQIEEKVSSQEIKLKALAEGSCDVTVTELNSGKTSVCEVTVLPKKVLEPGEAFFFFQDEGLTSMYYNDPSFTFLPYSYVWLYIAYADQQPLYLSDIQDIGQFTSSISGNAATDSGVTVGSKYPLKACLGVTTGSGALTVTAPNGVSKTITGSTVVKTISMCWWDSESTDPQFTTQTTTFTAANANFEVSLPDNGKIKYLRFVLNSGDTAHPSDDYSSKYPPYDFNNCYTKDAYFLSTSGGKLTGNGTSLQSSSYNWRYVVANNSFNKTAKGTYNFISEGWGVSWTVTVK